VTETSEPTSPSTLGRIRAAALWCRDTGLGITGFLVVLVVALAGWFVSFIGLHSFGVAHMDLSSKWAWLVPTAFDGAPFGLSIVVMRASSFGRSATVWRILIVAFTVLSMWINYEHISDPLGRGVAALMPPSAVALFEALLSEIRAASDRRKGIESRPRLHLLRWLFDFTGTLALVRCYVLDLPLPDSLAATQRRTASRATGSPRRTTPATPGAATASAPLPAPAATPGLPVPDPASTAPASPPQPAASPAPTRPATPASAPAGTATGSTEARDLDEVAETFRALAKRLGKSPSDQALADELGVGRSRAQQLRTAAIKAGHADLAKPLSAAS
jgi:hypothetical protein